MKGFKDFVEHRAYRDFLAHTHISIKNKYVYFGVSKAANSTVKHYLQGVEYLGTPYKVTNVHNKHVSPLLSPYQLDKCMLNEALYGDSYNRFTLVRNPLTRVLSCYLDRLQDEQSGAYKSMFRYINADPRKLTFEQFLEVIDTQHPVKMDSHWRPQVFETYVEKLSYTTILRFENLPSDLVRLKELTRCNSEAIFGDLDINKSPSITSASSKLNMYYTDKALGLAERIYADDFKAFDYFCKL